MTEGALVVFATFNFADTYSPVLFRLVQEGLYPGSAAPPALEIKCTLTDDAPDLPSLQQMHQLIAESPRAQAKFFLLMDDIADVYFMGMDYSFVGRHHVQQSFHHKFREDTLASTAIPSLGGYGVAELEPFESQARGFEHGHRKKYAIPKVRDVPCQTAMDCAGWWFGHTGPCRAVPAPQPLTFIDRALGRPSPQPLTFIDRALSQPNLQIHHF